MVPKHFISLFALVTLSALSDGLRITHPGKNTLLIANKQYRATWDPEGATSEWASGLYIKRADGTGKDIQVASNIRVADGGVEFSIPDGLFIPGRYVMVLGINNPNNGGLPEVYSSGIFTIAYL